MLFAGSDHFVFFFCQIVNKVEVGVDFIPVCFYFLGKKLGGTGPPAPPLATALVRCAVLDNQ